MVFFVFFVLCLCLGLCFVFGLGGLVFLVVNVGFCFACVHEGMLFCLVVEVKVCWERINCGMFVIVCFCRVTTSSWVCGVWWFFGLICSLGCWLVVQVATS